ncbi:MAG: hypothetical protein NVS2B14_17990 [Chamaesiphon sp.]
MVGFHYWFCSPGQFQWLFGVGTAFRKIVETSVLNTMVLAAFGLLVAVSGGILYLTVAEWRERRRRERDKRSRR